MIHEFNHPFPVVTEQGEEGYAIYVESSGMYDNDVWCVVLCNGGFIKHYNTSQLRIHHNATFEINKNGLDK
jgi:hypothetical protein